MTTIAIDADANAVVVRNDRYDRDSDVPEPEPEPDLNAELKPEPELPLLSSMATASYPRLARTHVEEDGGDDVVVVPTFGNGPEPLTSSSSPFPPTQADTDGDGDGDKDKNRPRVQDGATAAAAFDGAYGGNGGAWEILQAPSPAPTPIPPPPPPVRYPAEPIPIPAPSASLDWAPREDAVSGTGIGFGTGTGIDDGDLGPRDSGCSRDWDRAAAITPPFASPGAAAVRGTSGGGGPPPAAVVVDGAAVIVVSGPPTSASDLEPAAVATSAGREGGGPPSEAVVAVPSSAPRPEGRGSQIGAAATMTDAADRSRRYLPPPPPPPAAAPAVGRAFGAASREWFAAVAVAPIEMNPATSASASALASAFIAKGTASAPSDRPLNAVAASSEDAAAAVTLTALAVHTVERGEDRGASYGRPPTLEGGAAATAFREGVTETGPAPAPTVTASDAVPRRRAPGAAAGEEQRIAGTDRAFSAGATEEEDGWARVAVGADAAAAKAGPSLVAGCGVGWISASAWAAMAAPSAYADLPSEAGGAASMGAAAAAADGETEGGEEPDPPLEEGAARAGAARREKEAEIGTETTETEFRPFTSPAGEEGLSAGSGSTLVVDSGIVDKEVVYIASSSAGAVEGEGTVAGKNLSSTGCEEGGASASALVLALASASTTTTTVVVAAASASAYVDPPFYAVAISEDDAGERVGVGELDTPQEKEAITVTCPGEEKTGAAMTDVGPHLPLPSTAAAAAEREAQEKRPAEGLGLDFASPSASASATIDGEVDVVPLPPTGDGSEKLAVSILGGERAGDGNGSASADSRERKKCRDNGIDPAATKFDPDPDGAINPPRAPPEAMFRDISSAAAILSLLDDPGGAAAFSNGDAGVVDEGGRMAEPAIALRDGDGDGDGDNNDNDNNEDDDNDEAAAEPGRTAYRTSLAATMVRGDVFAAAPAIREATGFLVNSPASALAWKAAAAVFAAVTLEEDTAAVAAATVVAVEAEVPPEAPPPLSSSSATGTFLGDGGVEGGGGEKRAETSAVDPEAAVAAVSDNKPPSALTSVEEVFSAAAVSAPLEEGEERTTTSSVTLANGLASVEGADASSATLMARIAAVAAATAEAEGAPDKKERRGVETMLSSVEPARTVTPPVAAGVENDGAAVVDADVIDRRRLNRPSLKRKRRLRLRDGAAPASGSAFTCLAISPPPPSECGGGTSGAGFRYVALGDASGFVTLYVTSPFLSPVSRLETTASYRSHIEESAALSAMRDRHPSMPPEVAHARVRAGWRPEGGGGGDAVLASAVPAAAPTEALMYRSAERNHASAAASHPNAIEAVCFAGVATTGGGLAVVVSTKVEVEMIDCRFGAVLWRCDTYRIPAWSSTVSVDDDNNNGAGSGTGGRGAQRQRTRMSRGPAMRLESSPLGGGFVGNGGLVDGPGDGGILASFIFGTRRNPDDDKRRKKKTVEAPPLSAVAGEDNADPSLVSPLLLFRPAGARKEWKAGDDLTRGVEVMGIIPVERWTPKDHGNVEIDCPPRPLVLGPRTMAIWDRSDRSRILASVFNLSPSPLVRAADAVATSFSGSSSSSGNHVQELLLMDSSTGLILQRAPLPTRVSGSKTITSEAVGQTPDGTYVAAATSARGGIRLYETETLTILAVYGEGVALHGHTICWQDVSFVRWSRPDVQRDEAGHEVRRGRYVEREDELRHRLSRKDDVATGGRVSFISSFFHSMSAAILLYGTQSISIFYSLRSHISPPLSALPLLILHFVLPFVDFVCLGMGVSPRAYYFPSHLSTKSNTTSKMAQRETASRTCSWWAFHTPSANHWI